MNARFSRSRLFTTALSRLPARRPGARSLALLAAAVLSVAHGADQPAPPAAGTAAGASAAVPANPPAENAPLSAYTAAGSMFAGSIRLSELGWTEEQFAAFLDGLRAGYHGRALPMDAAAQRLWAETGRRIGELNARGRPTAGVAPAPSPSPARAGAAGATTAAQEIAAYMKEACRRLGLQQSESGLAYNVQPGRAGTRPGPHDTVIVSGIAYAADGTTKLPQLSFDHARMPLEGIMAGFGEGFQMMTVDSRAIFVLPPALSFGDGEWPAGVDRGTPLIFQVTLHEIIHDSASR